MNDQHLILNRWREEQKVFDTNLSVLRKQMKSVAMHDIRVATKKLRAFWKLYNLLKKETGWKHQLDKTEELFDVLGREQDIETCIELLSLYEKENDCRFDELRRFLTYQLKVAKGWVGKSIPVYRKRELLDISHVLKKDESLNDEKKLVQHIQDIINTHFLEIQDYFKRPHKVRQKLKSLYYWISTLPGDDSRGTPDAGKLHQIADELGEWHNQEILLTRVRHFRKDYLPKSFEEAATIKMLEEKLKTDKDKFRKSALNKIKRLLKKASASEARN